MWDVTESILDICIVYLRRTRSFVYGYRTTGYVYRAVHACVTRPRSLDDHRVQRPDGQVDGERGRQQGGSRRMAGTEPEHGRQRSQQPDGYLRAGAVSPLNGGRMFACNDGDGQRESAVRGDLWFWIVLRGRRNRPPERAQTGDGEN